MLNNRFTSLLLLLVKVAQEVSRDPLKALAALYGLGVQTT
jgi:hypothetical protein